MTLILPNYRPVIFFPSVSLKLKQFTECKQQKKQRLTARKIIAPTVERERVVLRLLLL